MTIFQANVRKTDVHSNDQTEVGELRDWRSRNGYTQEALAMALGVSRQTIIAWERSAGSLTSLAKLALLALEQLPEASTQVGGSRLSAASRAGFRKKDRN